MTDKAPAKKQGTGWLSVAVDYGPLIIFLAVYYYYAPADKEDGLGVIFAVVRSTAVFIVAALIALAISKFLLGKVSRMLMLSTILIVGFGGLTIWLRDPFYIQIKPTVLYIFFGLVLLVGWLMGKALLQWLLAAAFEGLSDEGWLILSRNWAFFFFLMAAFNEVLRVSLSFGDWLIVKAWAFFVLTFLFTITQIPMLMKHGFAVDDEDEKAVTVEPPTGE